MIWAPSSVKSLFPLQIFTIILDSQEEEVNSKKRELEVLVQEETNSMAELKKSQREIEALMKTAADIEYLLSEVRLCSQKDT